MALPIILMFVLLGISAVLLYLGTKTYSVFNGALLLSLSGTLIICTGLLLTGGLDLQTTSSIVGVGDTYTIVSTVIPFTDSTVSALSTIFTFGGIVPILLALVFTIIHTTQEYNKKNE